MELEAPVNTTVHLFNRTTNELQGQKEHPDALNETSQPRLHRTSKGLLRRPASFSPTDNVRNGPVAVLHACRPSHFTTRVIRGHLRRLYLLSSVPCLQRLSKLLQQPSTVAVPPKLRNRVEAEARQEALQLWQPQRQSSTKQRRDRRPGIREALALWSPRIHEVPAKQRFQGTHVGDHNVPKRFVVQPIQKLFQQPPIREVRPKLPRSEEDDAPGSEEDQKTAEKSKTSRTTKAALSKSSNSVKTAKLRRAASKKAATTRKRDPSTGRL